MAKETSGPDRLEEQAARIRRAEEEAGLMKAEPDEETKAFRETARGYRIGTDFVFTILTCLFIGWLADWWLGSDPWGLLIMLVLGFGIAMMNLWRAVDGSSAVANGKEKKE